MTKVNIFVSHSHNDANSVKSLKDSLMGDKELKSVTFNISSIPDDGPEPGTRWEQWIDEKLMDSNAMIYFITSNTKTSKWMELEIKIAERYGRTIIPFVYEDDIEIPPPLQGIQAIKGGNQYQRRDRLKKSLLSILKKEEERQEQIRKEEEERQEQARKEEEKRKYSAGNLLPLILFGPVGFALKKAIDERRGR